MLSILSTLAGAPKKLFSWVSKVFSELFESGVVLLIFFVIILSSYSQRNICCLATLNTYFSLICKN